MSTTDAPPAEVPAAATPQNGNPEPASIPEPKKPRAARRARANGIEQPKPAAPQQPETRIDLDRVRIEIEDHASIFMRALEAIAIVRKQNEQFVYYQRLAAATKPKLDAAESLVAQLRVLCATKGKGIPAPILDTLLGALSKWDQAVNPKQPQEGAK